MFVLRVLFYLWLLSIHSFAFATYSKISNSGKALPDTATLGSGPNDWACTYDSNTKLIWEVKTTDGGLRDQKWTYTWYDSNSPDGNKGTVSGTTNCKTNGRCDTEKFTQDVNAQGLGLCGAKDWRMPTNDELKTLVYCSDNQYATLPSGQSGHICKSNADKLTTASPTIDPTYFPNSKGLWFWSASVYSGYPSNAWNVLFDYGYDSYFNKYFEVAVRLVRGGQSFDPLGGATNAVLKSVQNFPGSWGKER